MRRPRGCELGEANEAVEWNGEVGGVSAKGGRIRWDVAGSRRSQKERAGGVSGPLYPIALNVIQPLVWPD